MESSHESILWAIPVAIILSHFHLTQEAILLYAIVIILDTILWILSKYWCWFEITSKDFNEWVVRKITKLVAPFIIAIMANVAWFSSEYVSWSMTAMMSLLIAWECYSALRHIYNINTGKQLPEMEVFDIVITKFVAIFKEKINNEVWALSQTTIKDVTTSSQENIDNSKQV